MRILVDLQVCQSESQNTVRARYSLSLCKALARHQDSDEVWVLLNNLFPDSVRDLRSALDGLVPPDRIAVFSPPVSTGERNSVNVWRKRAAERIRESVIGRIRPDVVHVGNLFEGLDDDAVSSLADDKRLICSSVSLYDRIPSTAHSPALASRPAAEYEERKLQSVKNADAVLVCTSYAREKAARELNLEGEAITDISFGCDERFRQMVPSPAVVSELRKRLGIGERFIFSSAEALEPARSITQLVKGFASLPQPLRERYPLLVAGQISGSARSKIMSTVRGGGIGDREILMTDQLREEDLPTLYNLCGLFVFAAESADLPLAVVEAMACGAPVIGARRTSVSEVIGREDALCDPEDPGSIAQAIRRGLTDDDLRQALVDHGLRRWKDFSWDTSAERALDAFRGARERSANRRSNVARGRSDRPRLAFISPLPPERSGIADYSAELIPELARYYDIDLVTDQPVVSDSLPADGFPVRSVAWLQNNRHRYERLLYHMGNSEFHAQMAELLQRHPGVVVLHDFFLGGLMNYLDGAGIAPGMLVRALFESHGYAALKTLFDEGKHAASLRFPCNLPVLARATGVIMHSQSGVELAQKWFGENVSKFFSRVPFLRGPRKGVGRHAARKSLGIGRDDFLVCSFGDVVETKLTHRIVGAWLRSNLLTEDNCRLVFVGEAHKDQDGSYGRVIGRTIADSGSGDRILVTGFVKAEEYSNWLGAADVAVQLRTQSRGETSTSVFDCMAAGLPVIVNDHGWASELPDSVAMRIADSFSDEELVAALQRLKDDRELREELARAGLEYVRDNHSPARVGALYHDAIELFYSEHPLEQQRHLLESIVHVDAPAPPTKEDIEAAAESVAANQHPTGSRQLFVDVSALVRQDPRTGIQRVTRGIVRGMLLNPPKGFRVEPVYGMWGRFYYARRFSLGLLLNSRAVRLFDAPIDAYPGDLFLGLDLVFDTVKECRLELMQLRNRGVHLAWVVYDLLPILLPDCFPQLMRDSFRHWFELVTELGDSLIAISRSVELEINSWLDASSKLGAVRPRTSFFHLGADIHESAPSRGLPSNAERFLKTLTERPTFLMVGTLEPRKGHDQVVAAFDDLWRKGLDVNLVIVGQEGWMIHSVAEGIRQHPECGRRLHWLEKVSDEYLDRIYSSSTALIAASRGEGFGLPLIEAAQHGLPILARDIPVFREVAQDNAYYFDTASADHLADKISDWLVLHARGIAPSSKPMKWLTWEQSKESLIAALVRTSAGARQTALASTGAPGGPEL